MSESVDAFWQRYLRTLPPEHPHRHVRADAFAFGDSPRLANELAALGQTGRKRATASLPVEFTTERLPLPLPGDVSIVTHSDGTPPAFAADEGEGDGTLAWWRAAHRKYFSRVCARLGCEFDEAAPVLCQRFRLVWNGR